MASQLQQKETEFVDGLYKRILPALVERPDLKQNEFAAIFRATVHRLPRSQLKKSISDNFESHCAVLWAKVEKVLRELNKKQKRQQQSQLKGDEDVGSDYTLWTTSGRNLALHDLQTNKFDDEKVAFSLYQRLLEVIDPSDSGRGSLLAAYTDFMRGHAEHTPLGTLSNVLRWLPNVPPTQRSQLLPALTSLAEASLADASARPSGAELSQRLAELLQRMLLLLGAASCHCQPSGVLENLVAAWMSAQLHHAAHIEGQVPAPNSTSEAASALAGLLGRAGASWLGVAARIRLPPSALEPTHPATRFDHLLPPLFRRALAPFRGTSTSVSPALYLQSVLVAKTAARFFEARRQPEHAADMRTVLSRLPVPKAILTVLPAPLRPAVGASSPAAIYDALDAAPLSAIIQGIPQALDALQRQQLSVDSEQSENGEEEDDGRREEASDEPESAEQVPGLFFEDRASKKSKVE